MRKIVVASLLLLASCDAITSLASGDGSAAANGKSVSFSVERPKVGTKRSRERVSMVTLNLKVGGLPTQVIGRSWARLSDEVLAVESDTVTKLKVTISEVGEEEAVNGVPREKPLSLTEGKTYLLTKSASGGEVTDESGGQVPLPEAEAVRARYVDFGSKDLVLDALASDALAPGQRLEALEQTLAKGLKGVEVDKVEAVFRGKADGRATFDISMTMISGAPYEMRTPLKGAMHFDDSNSWPLLLEVEGDIEGVAAEASQVQVTGGHMSIRLSNTYDEGK